MLERRLWRNQITIHVSWCMCASVDSLSQENKWGGGDAVGRYSEGGIFSRPPSTYRKSGPFDHTINEWITIWSIAFQVLAFDVVVFVWKYMYGCSYLSMKILKRLFVLIFELIASDSKVCFCRRLLDPSGPRPDHHMLVICLTNSSIILLLRG